MRLRSFILALCVPAFAACVKHRAPAENALPPTIVGQFTDDYGSRYSISPTQWRQGRAVYRIVTINAAAMYLIAQNDTNTTDRGKWTRVDWLPLPGMPPWEWAYCYSAYDAPTAQAAEAITVAKRDIPRTGCNGFPFSRMRRVP